MKRIVASAGMCALLFLAGTPVARAADVGTIPGKLYNTAKQKLKDGKTIIGATVSSFDPNIYCAVANAGFDYVTIEMQHSTITYADAAYMIFACRGAPAIPYIRVPDATESDIQKATDIGALGIIVPTVDTVEKAETAARWTRYPPAGRRSQGTGQGPALWGKDYRQTFNDNVMVVAVIETPAGAKAADKIAAVAGVDAILVGCDYPENDEIVTRVHDATRKAGKILAGPLAWKERPGYTFLMGSTDVSLLQMGAQKSLRIVPAQ